MTVDKFLTLAMASGLTVCTFGAAALIGLLIWLLMTQPLTVRGC